MIALCQEHAAKADGGYYPDEYLDRLKVEGRERSEAVKGSFDYLRRDAIAVIGSNVFYNVETIARVNGERAIYFRRDKDGYLLLNITLPTLEGGARAQIEDNIWTVDPRGIAVMDCPPRGRYIDVQFEDGDGFHVEYREYENADAYALKYPVAAELLRRVAFPVLVVEFWERSRDLLVEFGKRRTKSVANRTETSFSLFMDMRYGIISDPPLSASALSLLDEALARHNARLSARKRA